MLKRYKGEPWDYLKWLENEVIELAKTDSEIVKMYMEMNKKVEERNKKLQDVISDRLHFGETGQGDRYEIEERMRELLSE